MPYTPRQRRAAFAELSRRKSGSGGGGSAFKGMSTSELETYAHAPLEKKRKGGRMTGRRQAAALRGD